MTGYVLTFRENLDNGSDAVEMVRGVFAATGARLDEGFWAPGATWWYAWNELEIQLPTVCATAADLDAGRLFNPRWVVVRVFAPPAELRWERQGRGRVVCLLLEDNARRRLPPTLVAGAVHKETYLATPGRRLWSGRRLDLPGGSRRGRVEFPRPLDYGVEDHDYSKPLAARVYLYQDEDGLVQLVRYAEPELLSERVAVRPLGHRDRTLTAEGG
ncbi:hypothetical protein [Candidatus Desulforudis audaxviator]|uniref:Uncharacterized protein n=1 Tax=Desulforudis audaxviator (strain MP104C) TaxID=477974 RepID=B1I5N0_DESAP|nr:hypothetical protein [Candidatus Desulforudis audaxviator]ACA60295.1 hypothetical protein Daud_1799 [Candidatus Desulforudis audaxviator MP104C]AZK60343.1 hypothetical protein Daudx_1800 [Candidatus Desulforudis audaxviator]